MAMTLREASDSAKQTCRSSASGSGPRSIGGMAHITLMVSVLKVRLLTMERPNPAQWLWYAVGGRLPARLAPWVLHDVTAKTWVLRHAARGCVVLAPIAGACLLFPGPLALRLAMVLLVAIVGVYFSLSYVEEGCELRAVKHG